MGLGLNLGLGGFASNVADRISISGGIIDKTSDNFTDGFSNISENYFNLSSPDGVQSVIEAQNAASNKNNTALSAYASFLEDSALKPNKNSENVEATTSTTSNKLYTQDAQAAIYEVDTDDGKKRLSEGMQPYSVFNKFSLVNYRGTPLNPTAKSSKSTHYNTIDPTTLNNPTASKIIEMTSSTMGYRYNYADFAMTKYYNRMPNNMMITLRRFAFPTPDDIISPKATGDNGGSVDVPQPDIARAVTWMGGPTGNELSDILSFGHGFNWKEVSAAVQTLNSQKSGKSGEVGAIINSNRFLSAAASVNAGENPVERARREANGGFDAFSETYPNHVFGPLNVIKDMLVRDQGLKFDNEFTLKFEYELRDLGGANPKILMLDQLSNILALTYNNAPFWGGSVRYIGDGTIAKPLGNIQHIRDGNYKKFFESVVSDFSGGVGGSIMDDIKGLFEGKSSKILNNMIGGSLMKMFNTPQGGQAVNSLLTGDPTGQWHLTVGNPLNPIMVIGNLACTDTKVNFEGNIGPHDFPEKMVVTVTLKPGRPRDKAEIESMFNAGRGRFYLQPDDTADINNTYDVSAYGNKDRKTTATSKYTNTFRKITNG